MWVPKDLVPGSAILLLCAVLFYITTTFDSDPLGAAQGMPATHMPRLVLTVIAGLAVIMIGQGLRSGERSHLTNPPWRMWATAGLLAVTAFTFPVIGVPLAFFAVCVALPLLWGARNLPLILAFAVALPIAIYVVFQLLLGLRLPLGPLAFLS
ncbi:tripartite tricarboxylate transporter TctB family protein [Roseibium sp.]|uniref:tripartite tricarboxylate transporter TctB family protein n=1 Tax=Roseibium sp. TaxID=1936156 RepID=UPI003BAFB44C